MQPDSEKPPSHNAINARGDIIAQPEATIVVDAMDEDDAVSEASISILSEDSNPPQVLTHKLLLTDEDEEAFFQDL